MRPRTPLQPSILEIVIASPGGVLTEGICKKLGKNPQQLGSAFEDLLKNNKVLGFAGLWFTPLNFKRATEACMIALKEGHEKYPKRQGLVPSAVAKQCGFDWSGKPMDRIVAQWEKDGKVFSDTEGIRLPTFRAPLNKNQEAFLDRVIAEIVKEPINIPTAREISRVLGAPVQAVEAIFIAGRQSGELVDLGQGLFYTPRQLDAIDAEFRVLEKTGKLSASRVRDALKTTRRYAVPLLTHLRPIIEIDED